jgi:hypothetical protein
MMEWDEMGIDLWIEWTTDDKKGWFFSALSLGCCIKLINGVCKATKIPGGVPPCGYLSSKLYNQVGYETSLWWWIEIWI